tara:strand:+ start:34202 stop:34687 length:486 start_codon:yes stop_codon:yes gene_type:complete
MIVDCMLEDRRWALVDLGKLAEAAAIATFTHLGLTGFEISLLACNDARIADLNADFRGKPTPTNVLSWPSQERGAKFDGGLPIAPSAHEAELGDIAIAYDTCAAEAAAAGKSLGDHSLHLVVHGILHLLGYDHDRDLDATLMEGLESVILGNMGLADPYRV